MAKEKYSNLLLICAAGITTGLLVRSMQKTIEEQDLPIHVFSAPSIIAQQVIKDDTVDAIMVGPHISHELTRLKDLLNHENIPYQLIDEDFYRLLDGEKVVGQALRLMRLDETSLED